ncbi:MAG TPA: hypothetical protein VFT22_42630 [Kofleriaceae bacterium]|nr:hypothetical protein [Kofleriaceae bacterium]
MTRAAAKEIERKQLDAMIRLLGLEIDSEPTALEPPDPDFIFTLHNGPVLGVELVRAIDEYLAGGSGARTSIKTKVHAGLAAARINARVKVQIREDTAAALNKDRRALEREGSQDDE